MSEALTPTYLSDLAGLMFAAVVLWAYMSFSQYLIIWSGNLPEEIMWYLHRMQTRLDGAGDHARHLPFRGAVLPAAHARHQADGPTWCRRSRC